MSELHVTYLNLLRELSGDLERLSELAQEKAAAVRRDDLIGLDQVLKQEQAMALNLRGLEMKRLKLVPQLGLDGVPLSALPEHYPEPLQKEAAKVVAVLRDNSDIYRSYANQARTTLELNLHQIEKFISDSGVDPKLAADGYEAPPVEPPKRMKTDFRA